MQNKEDDEIIGTSTTALRDYIFQALVVVITVAGLQSGVLVLDTFFFPFSFFFSFPPSLNEVWLHALLLCNIWFFFSDIHQHTVFHKQLFFKSLVRLEGVASALRNKK